MKLPKSLKKLKNKLRYLLIVRRVTGESMLPTLRPGKIVVGSSLLPVKAGRIIVFRHKNIEKIKRVKVIKDNQLEVVGDNPGESTDSRTFGLVNQDEYIAGVIWPWR